MRNTLLLSLRILFVLVLICLPSSALAANQNSSSFDRVDDYLESQIQAMHIPGLAIGVVKGSEIIHLRGYGTATPDGQPVTPQTPFILGSTSKSISALAVMQLVEAGKLELDAPVSTYLPWFNGDDVTIRHLLNQNSGITTTTGRSVLADDYDGSDAIQVYARKMSAAPRHSPAGIRYQYSNANYVILGAVIEAVTGQTYETYVNENVFKPLDMVNSYASRQSAGSHPVAAGHTQVFNISVPFNAPYPAGAVPAGYLFSSAEDMSHYLTAHLNDGQYQGKQILSPAGVSTLHHGAALVSDGIYYAMGWEVREYEGLKTISHRGDLSTFQSIIILLPEHDLGLVMLTNVYSGFNNTQISHLAWDVAHLLLDQEPVALLAEPMMYVVIAIVAVLVVLTLALLGWAYRILLSGRTHGSRIRMAVAVVLLLGIAGFILFVFPNLFEAPMPVMLLFSPELAWPILISAIAAVLGAIAFPVLQIASAHSKRV